MLRGLIVAPRRCAVSHDWRLSRFSVRARSNGSVLAALRPLSMSSSSSWMLRARAREDVNYAWRTIMRAHPPSQALADTGENRPAEALAKGGQAQASTCSGFRKDSCSTGSCASTGSE